MIRLYHAPELPYAQKQKEQKELECKSYRLR